MSRIGTFKFSKCFEIEYGFADDGKPPIEVEIEGTCVLHCDSSEDGVYAEEVEARVVEQELTETEIDALDLACHAAEQFMDAAPVIPKPGTKLRDHKGTIWTIVGSGLHHEEAQSYILLERPGAFLTGGKINRVIEDTMLLCSILEGEGDEARSVPYYQEVDPDAPPPKPGEWRPFE